MVRFWRHNLIILNGAIYSRALLALLCLFVFVSCVEGDNATDSLFGDGTDEIDVPVPTDRTVKITLPAADGESVGYLAHVEGNCNPAGGIVSFTGSGTGTTICSLGGTFAADIDVSSAGVGTVTIKAKLTDATGNESAVSTRRFTKTSTACDSLAARTDTYANFSTGGDGGATPWQICTADQFSNIRSNLTHNFVLENDINFEDTPLNAMGGYFEGELDGQGYTVRNTSLTSSGDDWGIFRYARGPAHIHDINFDNINVSARNRVAVLVGWVREKDPDVITIENINISNSTASGSSDVALLVGRYGRDNNAARPTYGVVDNITVTDSDASGTSYVAGVIGYVRNTVGTFTGSNLTLDGGDISGSGSYVAGIIGYMEEAGGQTSTDYSVTGEVSITGSTHYVGSIMGRMSGGTGTNFTATANINANGTTRDYVGGLVGYINGTFSGTCSYTGTINASDIRYVGGAFGYVNDNMTIDGCVVDANVSGREQVGGIIGRMDTGGTISNINAVKDTANTVTASSNYSGGVLGYGYDNIDITNVQTNTIVNSDLGYAGGMVGYVRNGADFLNSTAYGDVTGTAGQRVGGFVGSAQNPDVDNCHAEGDVTGDNLVGGFIGRAENSGQFDLSTAIGNVTSTGGANCGGFAGYSRQSTVFRDSSAEGDVDCAGGYAGGFLGGTYRYTQLLRVYATGDVTAGGDYVGGLMGGSNTNHNTVRDSFAVGDVSSSGNHVGGLIGYIRANGTGNLYNAFALGNVAGNQNVGGLIGYYYRNSNNSMRQMYYLGRVTKPIGATGGDATFGAVVGNSNDLTAPYGVQDSTVFYLTGSDVYDEASAGSLGGQNSFGTAKSDADLKDSGTYPAAFDFVTTPEWEMNLGTYVLPGTSGTYAYPLLDWQQ